MTLSPLIPSIKRCFNLDDFRRQAKHKLPSPLFHYIDGGADDEITLYNNTQAFDKYQIVPRCLQDVTRINMQTKVLGCELDWPVLMSPTGMSRFFHHQGERAVARAAAQSGTMYSLSTVATTTIEDVASATSGPKMFQLYVLRDHAINDELIERCRAANYDALCLTVDTVVQGNRERDLRTGMTVPPKPTLQSLASFALHPAWCYHYFTTPPLEMANLSHHIAEGSSQVSSLGKYINEQFDRALNWAYAEKVAARWQGPFAIKGILCVEDARRAADIGASAVIISNHGGRQLDGVPAPIDLVAEIADALGDRVEIILDGGVRRGTHVLKALAMGATACMMGRPYLYGLAAGGQAGVERVLALLKSEIERDMILSGQADSNKLGPGFIRT
ncbi:MAG: alpha-hydroxy-acid oxidizing protein [Gammaproteobacteria bacterium]|nr:alpha-hydroxy-acid oxidizing protein [Gammaproteobacteria bacterium]MBQ0839902.1 alpha-hydroxy-acid oxidizing protein [Gammaproteobacteria bacterium]